MKLLVFKIIIFICFIYSISKIEQDIYAQNPDLKTVPTQEESLQIPQGVLLNWEFAQITEEEKVSLKNYLENSLNILETNWLSNSKTLSSYIKDLSSEQNQMTTNQQLLAKNIKIGNLKIGVKPRPLVLQPILTSLAKYYIVFLHIADLHLNTLIISTHQVIPKYLHSSNVTNSTKLLEQNLERMVIELLDEAITKLNDYEFTPPKSTLCIEVSLIKESDNLNVGSLTTLNLLLENKLIDQKIRVVRTFGLKDIQLIKYLIKSTLNIKRHTRVIQTNWIWPHTIKDINFPLNFRLEYNILESLFAQRINIKPNVSEYTFNIINNKINFDLDNKLKLFLEEENKALSLKERPQVAKIYGAWAYLDKGRAYGLVINHRLQTVDEDGELIKGHVVGYFGPSLNLTSPKGYRINDGAIVFIRKGQSRLKVGQFFEYDTTQYPTKWPPTNN